MCLSCSKIKILPQLCQPSVPARDERAGVDHDVRCMNRTTLRTHFAINLFSIPYEVDKPACVFRYCGLLAQADSAVCMMFNNGVNGVPSLATSVPRRHHFRRGARCRKPAVLVTVQCLAEDSDG